MWDERECKKPLKKTLIKIEQNLGYPKGFLSEIRRKTTMQLHPDAEGAGFLKLKLPPKKLFIPPFLAEKNYYRDRWRNRYR
jgi:hypothetical protein